MYTSLMYFFIYTAKHPITGGIIKQVYRIRHILFRIQIRTLGSVQWIRDPGFLFSDFQNVKKI